MRIKDPYFSLMSEKLRYTQTGIERKTYFSELEILQSSAECWNESMNHNSKLPIESVIPQTNYYMVLYGGAVL